MRTYKVRFPSGHTADELFHYMGADDEITLHERPAIARQLVAKCFKGKIIELTEDELNQLIKEVVNAEDIKKDHIGDGSWTELQHYNLNKYLVKLKALINPPESLIDVLKSFGGYITDDGTIIIPEGKHLDNELKKAVDGLIQKYNYGVKIARS